MSVFICHPSTDSSTAFSAYTSTYTSTALTWVMQDVHCADLHKHSIYYTKAWYYSFIMTLSLPTFLCTHSMNIFSEIDFDLLTFICRFYSCHMTYHFKFPRGYEVISTGELKMMFLRLQRFLSFTKMAKNKRAACGKRSRPRGPQWLLQWCLFLYWTHRDETDIHILTMKSIHLWFSPKSVRHLSVDVPAAGSWSSGRICFGALWPDGQRPQRWPGLGTRAAGRAERRQTERLKYSTDCKTDS